MASLKPSLADPYLKTSRAKEHLEDLRKELIQFYASKPFTLIGEDDVEHQKYRVKFDIRDTPDNIHLILGDLLYNLRSSLDQLVWWLAKLTTPYPKGTQFPIFDKDISSDKNAGKRFETQTAGVPAEAVQIIKSLQPYHGGDVAAIRSHPLWRLNLLCNIDKHRRIALHGSVTEVQNVFPLAAGPFLVQETPDTVSVPLRFKNQVTLNPNTTFKVVFGDFSEGIDSDIAGIDQIYSFVTDDVIPRFARFF